jgi:hypothetical protein
MRSSQCLLGRAGPRKRRRSMGSPRKPSSATRRATSTGARRTRSAGGLPKNTSERLRSRKRQRKAKKKETAALEKATKKRRTMQEAMIAAGAIELQLRSANVDLTHAASYKTLKVCDLKKLLRARDIECTLPSRKAELQAALARASPIPDDILASICSSQTDASGDQSSASGDQPDASVS